MDIEVVAYGIAKEIVGGSTIAMAIPENISIRELKDQLVSKYPAFAELASIRFAVNEDYEEDDYIIQPKDEVVIIPPVSGG